MFDCGFAKGLLLCSLLLPGCVPASAQKPPNETVRLLALDGTANFPEATYPNAINYACTDTPEILKGFFTARNLPFEEKLVHSRHGARACHVFYEPTIPGFRASRDNQEIRELYASFDAVTFLALGEIPGDSLDIAKVIFPRLPRQIEVRLSISGGFDQTMWEPSSRFHFSGIRHTVSLFEIGTNDNHPWAQDHLKAGFVNGEERTLVPRRLFEGQRNHGELVRPMLDALENQRFTRSKLSWEGGDLQFIAAPQDPSKTILAHGDAAKVYWGKRLSAAEYSYVLRVEFGADMALDLSETGVHADYSVAFLPKDNIVLVSQSVRRSPAVARAAAFELAQTFGDVPPREIRRIAAALADWDGEILTGKLGLKSAMDEAWRAIKAALPDSDIELDSLLSTYIERNCPNDPRACFEGSLAAAKMLQSDRELMRRGSSRLAEDALNASLRPYLLGIIADQLEADAWPEEERLNKAARQLAAWGFRVVRIPHITAQTGDGWPGVAYANMLVFDRHLFVPTLRLGRVEERYLSKLRSDLGGEYEIIPVDARISLVRNGGVHCIFGIIREP